MASLTLSNVSYKYRNAENPSVKNASCPFEPGRLYAIVGPSGSGKSTLLSMLAGLDLPTEGDVLFDGKKLRELDLDRYRRESIAMIFQAFQLFPLLTVTENVCYPMELCGVKPKEARERAKLLLDSVGITGDKQKRFPANLSGGEQQRVAIARSLSAGAKTLLADEPTGNLDEANTKNIMEILKALAHDDGCCVIVVTHDPEVAEVSDVVYRMKDGVLSRER
ncbi:MAG: ABC transporter ATP-binding protein [Clostridiales bacterium]|nr:ABC transporter ATP-binding protein [Clostridiales bacterium]